MLLTELNHCLTNHWNYFISENEIDVGAVDLLEDEELKGQILRIGLKFKKQIKTFRSTPDNFTVSIFKNVYFFLLCQKVYHKDPTILKALRTRLSSILSLTHTIVFFNNNNKKITLKNCFLSTAVARFSSYAPGKWWQPLLDYDLEK